MESSEKIKRYKKMRATQQWLIKTCIHCMIIWSLLNMIILLVNKYGQIFHIPKSREYLCYTLLIVLFVLIRFPELLSRFEAIERLENRQTTVKEIKSQERGQQIL